MSEPTPGEAAAARRIAKAAVKVWKRRRKSGIAEPGETVEDVAAMLLAFAETHEFTGEVDEHGRHMYRRSSEFNEIERHANEGE